jgi:hypothetical protein
MHDTYEYYEQLRANDGEPPQKITIERFWEMLNVLPPCKWTRLHSSESFFISEAETEDLHRWFARIGDDYFELVAPRSLNHEEILGKIISRLPDVFNKIMES